MLIMNEEVRVPESSSAGASTAPFSKETALALGLPSGNVDILRHRSVQRDAMPDWKLFQLFDVPADPRNFKARLSYTKMDSKQSAHMNALHRLVYGKPAEDCGRKVCKEYARAYAIEIFLPCAMRLDWAQFAVDKRGKKAHRTHHLLPFPITIDAAKTEQEDLKPVVSREWKLQNAKKLLGFQSV